MSVPSEVEALIADAPLSAHVATSVNDRPHVAPVWYGYRDGVVSILTGGKKLRNVRRNPRVAVSIEKAREGRVEWSVSLLGTAAVVEDPERMRDAEDRIFGKYREGENGGEGEDESEAERDDADGHSADDSGESEPESALVEITVGSVSWSEY